MSETTTITIGLAIALAGALGMFAAAWGGTRQALRSVMAEISRLRDHAHTHGNALAAHEARITSLEDKP